MGRRQRHGLLLGFDAVATGHHANIGRTADGHYTLERGADPAKDQSYVVHMPDQAQLARTMFPVGGMQKSAVRELPASIDLRTATKPDSQDVCSIDEPMEGEVLVQCSAHGRALPATMIASSPTSVRVVWDEPQRRIAPGQSVVAYDRVDAACSAAASAPERAACVRIGVESWSSAVSPRRWGRHEHERERRVLARRWFALGPTDGTHGEA